MANTISNVELDFDLIKENLKEFLRSKSDFTDFDFEGSALSQLIDLLAFNDHYLALLANFSLNESFLDSASKRSSVVSKAKSLGYTPKSFRSARVDVDVKYTFSTNTNLSNSVVIPKGTVFSINNPLFQNLLFFAEKDSFASLFQDGSYWTYNFTNVTLVEGILLTQTFDVVDINGTYQIPNQNVDTSTLSVIVKNSVNSKAIPYFLNEDITLINENSTVFFLDESVDGYYQISFGDGILGSRPAIGDVVQITYAASSGEVGNNIKSFVTNYSINGQTPYVSLSSNNDRSIGGAYKETIDSIKFNAPKYFLSNKRAITPQDYKVLLANLYDNIDSIAAWGGEDNIPPQYGKVFISIKPKSGDFLTLSAKEEIINQILKGKGVPSITPDLIDPEFIYIKIDSTVLYDSQIDKNSLTQLKNSVINSILEYNNSNLKKFQGSFRYSQLLKQIDNTNQYIISNITNIQMYRELIVGNQSSYTINFFNGISKPKLGETSISTNSFKLNGSNIDFFLEDYIDSNNQGRLRLFYNGTTDLSGTKKIIANNFAGLVDYASGKITINNVDFQSNTLLDLIANPSINDLSSVRNNLFEIRESDIVVTIEQTT